MRMAVSTLLLASALAVADASAGSADPAEGEAGMQGGICIGTVEECAARTDAPPRAGFDMMVNFGLDSAELTPDAKARLAEFARALRDSRLKPHDFVIEGHTDALGGPEYNLGLSERRARAVAGFLVESGLGPERVTAVGKGMESPRAEDPYDPTNRRVEMRIAE